MTRPDPNRTDPTWPEPNRPEPNRPRENRQFCFVIGLSKSEPDLTRDPTNVLREERKGPIIPALVGAVILKKFQAPACTHRVLVLAA